MLEFDQRQGSSDGGAVLLKAAERRYGLIASMSGCLHDHRQAGKVDHSLRDLFSQRVFSIGCGYADANDSARLAADPVHKMLLDRDPVTGLDMASQPTLSRFENAVGPRQLYHMGAALAESVIERHASGCTIVPGWSPSIWIRPTILRMGRSSCPSSTATMTMRATCR